MMIVGNSLNLIVTPHKQFTKEDNKNIEITTASVSIYFTTYCTIYNQMLELQKYYWKIGLQTGHIAPVRLLFYFVYN